MNEQLQISIRFYEELNDFLKKYPRKTDIHSTFSNRRSVKDLIESFGVPHTEVDLILVEGESVDFNYIVQNNDRISAFPVFERLNIQGLSPLRKSPLRKNKFVLDVHLGKLARHMRMLGFDTDYNNFRDDRELAEISSRENRILLTRDRGLVMRKIVQRGFIIRSDNPLIQIEEVLDRLDLRGEIHPFSRCISCNGQIKRLEEENGLFSELKEKIPPRVLSWCTEFNYCPSCEKVYWKGGHYEDLLNRINCLKK